jgi:hypothetical protein
MIILKSFRDRIQGVQEEQSSSHLERNLHPAGNRQAQAKDKPHLGGLILSISTLLENIEKYIRLNIERNSLTNDFKRMLKITGKRLYITAMALDDASRVVFGPDEKSDVKISEDTKQSEDTPQTFDVRLLSELLGKSERRVRELAQEGKIRPTKSGRIGPLINQQSSNGYP